MNKQQFEQNATIALLSNEEFVRLVKVDSRYTIASVLAQEISKVVSQLKYHEESKDD